MKKRLGVGTSWAGYPQVRRVIYSKIIKNAQQEIQANKELALSWFRRFQSFQQTVPGKSYAAAAKANLKKLNVITGNVKNSDTKCSDKKSCHKRSDRSVDKYPHVAAIQSCTVSTVAGVPVKYGKCVPAKYSVQVPVSTVPLKNTFQCLQDLGHSQNDVIHNENHVCISVNEQSVSTI